MSHQVAIVKTFALFLLCSSFLLSNCQEPCFFQLSHNCPFPMGCSSNFSLILEQASTCNGSITIAVFGSANTSFDFTTHHYLEAKPDSTFTIMGIKDENDDDPKIQISMGSLSLKGFSVVTISSVSMQLSKLLFLQPTFLISGLDNSQLDCDFNLNHLRITGYDNSLAGILFFVEGTDVSLWNIEIANLNLYSVAKKEELFSFMHAYKKNRVGARLAFSAVNVTFQNITCNSLTFQELSDLCKSNGIQIENLSFLNHTSWILLEEFDNIDLKQISLISAHNIVGSGVKLKNTNKNEKLSIESFLIKDCILDTFEWLDSTSKILTFAKNFRVIGNTIIDSTLLKFQNHNFTLLNFYMEANTFVNSSLVFPMSQLQVSKDYPTLIQIENFTVLSNTFTNFSSIFNQQSCNSEVMFTENKFQHNAFLNESHILSFNGIKSITVMRNYVSNSFSQRDLFQLVNIQNIIVESNEFTDFEQIYDLPEDSLSRGGIFELDACQTLTFAHNTINNYFAINYKVISIRDNQCEKSDTAPFIIYGNTFTNNFIVGDNDYTTLMLIEFHFSDTTIILHSNRFDNNTLETTFSYIRSATALLVYSVLSEVRVSNAIFTRNRANLRINCAGFYVNSLTIEDSSFEENGVSQFTGIYDYDLVSTEGGGITFTASTLELRDTNFTNNFAYEGGAIFIHNSNWVLGSQKRNNYILIENCRFINNSAIQGGAIFFASANNHFKVKIKQCLFNNNTAMTGGGAVFFSPNIVTDQEDHIFEIIDSSFLTNNARKSQGGCIVNAAQVLISLSNNNFINEENTNAFLLKHQNSTFIFNKCNFTSVPSLRVRTVSDSAELITIDSSFTQNLTVEMNFCRFVGFPYDQLWMHPAILNVIGSEATLKDVGSVYENISFNGKGVIQIQEGAKYIVTGSNFSNINMTVSIQPTKYDLNNPLAISVLLQQTVVIITTASSLIAEGLYFDNLRAGAIIITDNSTANISNSEFRGVAGTQGGALSFYAYEDQSSEHITSMVNNCNFYKTQAVLGGGIAVLEKRVVVSNCYFKENNAINGAGVISLTRSDNQSLSLINCTFEKNDASSGGGIHFLHKEPEMKDMKFINNAAAVYGVNISSYATGLKLRINNTLYDNDTYTIENQTSYSKLNVNSDKLSFILIDDRNQHVKIDQTSVVTLTVRIPGSNGTFRDFKLVKEKAKDGVVTFNTDNIVISGKPNSTAQLIATLESNEAQFFQTIRLRECIPGEVYDEKVSNCVKCAPGTYAFYPTETECKACPPNAICYGGNNLSVFEGYWRPSKDSINISSCLHFKDNCEGGPDSKCRNNTSGMLCGSCDSNASPPLVRGNVIGCVQCTYSLTVYIIFYVLFLMIMGLIGTGYVFISLKSNISFTRLGRSIEDTEENIKSRSLGIYARIFSTYCQFIMLLKKFGFDLTGVLTTLLANFGNPAKASVASIRCFLALTGLYEHNTVILAVSQFLSPVLIWLFACIFIHLRRRTEHGLGRGIEYFAAFTIVYFWQQPAIIDSLMSYFSCENVLGKDYLRSHLSVECGSTTFFILHGLAIFGIALWLIILPMVLFGRLILNRKELREDKYRIGLGVLYNGYKLNYFWWGLITFAFKNVLMIFASVWNSAGAIHGMTLLVLCAMYCKILLILQPYSLKDHNRIEFVSFLVYSIVIFCIANYDETKSKVLQGMLVALMVLANLYFLLRLAIGVFNSLREKAKPYIDRISLFFKSVSHKKSKKKLTASKISDDGTDGTGTETNYDDKDRLYSWTSVEGSATDSIIGDVDFKYIPRMEEESPNASIISRGSGGSRDSL